MNIDIAKTIAEAKAEIRAEMQRAAIESEKARLRALPQTSFWQRLANLLPFTITFNWRK
jgi:hypothetical protein